MIRKIIELSKVFIKDYFQNLYIFNKDTKKINKKSGIIWLLIVIVSMIGFISLKVIEALYARGQAILFLKIYLPILATIFMFQAILVCSNVFFFSKDLEYILPMPIKPIELLIAKFNNVISITYSMEGLFLFVPLVIYGIITLKPIMYYFLMLIVLIMFPIFLITIVSIVMLFIMQFTKFIKNKDIFQILIVTVLTVIITTTEMYLFQSVFDDNIIQIQTNENSEMENAELNIEILNNKLDKLNNYFLVINPCIKLLNNFQIKIILIQLIKIIIINIILFFIFVFLGKILYLKNLLKNIAYINKKKNTKKIIKNKYKKNKIKISYIKNEFRKIIKNPTFFIQCIFQYIFIDLILLLIINFFFPSILKSFEEENMINELGINNFILQCICMILGILQILFTLGNLAITAISRDGKNAIVMKYIPVSLYKQFIWKNIPQILINSFTIIGILMVIVINTNNIPFIYYLIGVILAMLLNFINCIIMSIIDLKRPNLDWINETSLLKDNRNKLYQYITTIVIVLLLIYFTQIFNNINIKFSLAIMLVIFSLVIIALIIYVKKNINKLFNRIY